MRSIIFDCSDEWPPNEVRGRYIFGEEDEL